MGIRRIGVDQERRAVDRAVGVEALTVDAVATAVLAVVGPHRDEAAAGQADDVRLALRDRTFTPRVGLGLASLGHAGGVVALEIDVAVLGEAGVVIVGAPRHDEAAVGGGRDVGLELAVVGRAVHKEFAAQQRAVVGEALRIDARAAAVLSLGAPGDHVAAAGQRRYYRLGLRVRRVAVDTEFRTGRYALGVEALGVDAIAPAVLTVRGPDGDVAAVGQARHLGRLLRARHVGVDLFIAEQRLRAVGLGSDVDGHGAWNAGAAVAITDDDANGAAGHRRGGRVGVGQVLDHRLDRVGRGVGVELQHQVGAIGAQRNDAADGRAAIADHAAGHADLPRAVALVADAELVLRGHVLRQLRGVDVAVAGNHAHPESAAVEIGGIAVGQADAGVDELGCGIHQVLCEAQRRRHVDQQRRGRVDDRPGGAEDLVEDAVGVLRAALLVVAGPDDDGVGAGKPDDVGQVLRAGRGRVDDLHAVDLVAAGVELLRHHVLAAAAERCARVAVPGDDEAAAVERGYTDAVALVAGGIAGVDGEFAADLRACGVEQLCEDAVAGVPNGDETAAGEAGHVRPVLGAGNGGIDRDQATDLAAVVGEDLRADTVATGVAAGIAPHGHIAAAAQRRQLGLVLRRAARRVERDLGAERAAVGGETLG